MNRDIQLKRIFYSQHERAELALANKLQPISEDTPSHQVVVLHKSLLEDEDEDEDDEDKDQEEEEEPSIPRKTR